MKTHYFLFIYLMLSGLMGFAQDLQYSQYYNAPLFLNPAFTGTAENSRAVVNYRKQWPGLNNPFQSYSLSIDHLIEPANAGVGLVVKRDEQGSSNLTATELGIIGSYLLPLNASLVFVPAIQASWVNRSLNYRNLVFEDQFDLNDPTYIAPTSEEFAYAGRQNYLDLSAGGVLYSEDFWFGISLNHMNRPNQVFLSNMNDRLPIKASFNAGYKFYFEKPRYGKREKSVIPTFLYKTQGRFDQLDIGVYGIYSPLTVGLWYRGLPVKPSVDGRMNHDAIVVMAGIRYKRALFAYSYDFTISPLRKYTGGAHEISLAIEWKTPYKTKKRGKPIPCPKFY